MTIVIDDSEKVCVCVARGGGRLFERYDWFKYFRLRGRLFEEGDLRRDGYYSRKYGTVRLKLSWPWVMFRLLMIGFQLIF